MNQDYVLDLLVSRGMLDQQVADDIRREHLETGVDILPLVVNYGVLENEEAIYPLVANELGAEYYDLNGFDPPAELLETIPAGMARLHGALPIWITNEGLFVALTDPLNPQVIEDLRFALGKEIHPVVARPDHVANLIEKCYGRGGENLNDVLAQIIGGPGKEISDADLEAEANSAPIIRYVDLVLFNAIKERASDIHFEPFQNEFKIRYRVDGALYEMAPPPLHLALPIISRIKVMANLNIAERRVPQDGRIMKSFAEHSVDLRVSCLPTIHGESVVCRVLDRSSVNLELENLGMPPDLFDYIIRTIQKPNGIFIVTGPTGAGKTTTLYAALRKINTIDAKLLTAEDPVEYDIDGILQVPVNEAIGLSFPRVLRAFLRQDPDRIMVGEMRDVATAQIAIQASLTGHLVLSTLHTNDAPGAVTRLIDMGCEPFLVSATLEAVLAQRLVRTICKDCRAPYEPSESIIMQLGLSPHELGDKHFYTGQGCNTCGGSGYKGRKGLYELLDITDPLRDMITDRAPTVVLRQKAIELGMQTLREDGLRNIYMGTTTIEEVLKYT